MNNAVLVFAETSLGQLRDEAHAGDDNARIQFNTAIRSLIDGNSTALQKRAFDYWYISSYPTQTHYCGGFAAYTWSDDNLWGGFVNNVVNGLYTTMGSIYVDASSVYYRESSFCAFIPPGCSSSASVSGILGADGCCVSAEVSDTIY